MRTSSTLVGILTVAGLIAVALPVRAQITVVPGILSGASETGPSIGGLVSVDVTSWGTVEAATTYYDRGTGAHAFALHGSLLVNLRIPSERVLPYVAAGAGMYRASFHLGTQRFFGGRGMQYGPGTTLCNGTGECPYGSMPRFYGRRLGAFTVPAQGAGFGTRTFTDPAVSLGGGLRIAVASHVFVRPDVRVLLVHGGGVTETYGAFSLAVGYRF
jgi:hypothetical protein